MIKLCGLVLAICVVMATSSEKLNFQSDEYYDHGHHNPHEYELPRAANKPAPTTTTTTTTTPAPVKSQILNSSISVMGGALNITKVVVHEMITLLNNSGKLINFDVFMQAARPILHNLEQAILEAMKSKLKGDMLTLLKQHIVTNLISNATTVTNNMASDISESSE